MKAAINSSTDLTAIVRTERLIYIGIKARHGSDGNVADLPDWNIVLYGMKISEIDTRHRI